MPTDNAPRIAIVIPVFNEEPVMQELFKRLGAVFSGDATVDWSVIMVDDGSKDRSGQLIEAKAARDPRYGLVSLSRNFGHQAAIMAGLERAADEGVDAAITMDADLQDPPELISELVARWREGSEVVLAVRRSRREQGLRRMGFDLFHRGFNYLTDFRIVSNTGTFGLLGREALEALVSLPERHRFFPGIRAWVGFATAEVLYDRQERAAGKPAQTFVRLVRYALDGIFSFSYLPLRLMTYVGLVISGLSLVLATFFIVRRLLGVEVAFTGFTTLVTLTLFIGGVQLLGIGVIGEYLARVYDEVKQRPLYVVRKKKK
ncbi:MAG: glycosyltransferase family 2 protein [Opitutaceae bacterium]|jgi:glycosyltransferase involved in cell wall biosynthesis